VLQLQLDDSSMCHHLEAVLKQVLQSSFPPPSSFIHSTRTRHPTLLTSTCQSDGNRTWSSSSNLSGSLRMTSNVSTTGADFGSLNKSFDSMNMTDAASVTNYTAADFRPVSPRVCKIGKSQNVTEVMQHKGGQHVAIKRVFLALPHDRVGATIREVYKCHSAACLPGGVLPPPSDGDSISDAAAPGAGVHIVKFYGAYYDDEHRQRRRRPLHASRPHVIAGSSASSPTTFLGGILLS
jgi:hypothetical protein